MDIITNESIPIVSNKTNNETSKTTYKYNYAGIAFEENDKNDLYRAINNALNEWKNAIANFDTAEAPELVDYYTYKMKACEIRYQYLLKKFKEFNSGA